MPQHNILNLTGKTFERLTVIGLSERGRPFWKVVCECGTEKEVRSGNLQSGTTVSCGCARTEKTKTANRRHGHRADYKATKVYKAWADMIARCDNPNIEGYKRYGGRGISYCDSWKVFENFLEDMGEPENAKLSLERLNVDGNYCKDNCVWATAKAQARNRRNSIFVSKGGVKTPLKEACEALGLNYSTVHYRIRKYGWPVEKALNTDYSEFN